ncbi:hypothetical protein FOA52_007526 [Chlamydomonas sp. UWO 241]|nr:hypothetical protein FOA52_007526 [Chlamydomonas sp. UWO 241]
MRLLATAALLALGLLVSRPPVVVGDAPDGLETLADYIARFGECTDTLSLPTLSQRPDTHIQHTPGGCDYGGLPGYWNSTARDAGTAWRVLTPGCATRNLLPQHAGTADCKGGPKRPPKIVLILGDSVDRELVQGASKFLDLELLKCRRVRVLQPACGDAVVATMHLYGVSMEGPWHYNISEPYTSILKGAVEHDWRGHYKLPDPDLVVMNSNMWDISRAYQLAQANLTNDWNMRMLPRAFVDEWLANATVMVNFVKRTFPHAALAWHTVAPGSHKYDAYGTMNHLTIGRHSFVVQLNAAGRMLAQRFGMSLVDYDQMVAGFHDWSYLKDQHHPSEQSS